MPVENEEIEITFPTMQRMAKLTIRHEASMTIWKQYEDRVAATGDFNSKEASGVIGEATVNDMILDAILEAVARETTLEAIKSIERLIAALKWSVEEVVNVDGDPAALNREIYALEKAVKLLTAETMKKTMFK